MIDTSARQCEILSRNLGKAIRGRRRQKGVTQQRFAELAGLQRTYISDVERGSRNISLSTLALLAKALSTTISELTTGIENRQDVVLTTEDAELLAEKVHCPYCANIAVANVNNPR